MLPHLHNGWQVDQAILSEEDRVVVIRFGHDWDPTCMKMDEVLYSIAEKVMFIACPAFLWCGNSQLGASRQLRLLNVKPKSALRLINLRMYY